MPRLRLIPAIVAICVVCAASSFACPVAKKVIASDLIEPPPFGFIPGQKCDECPIPDLMVLDFDAGKLPASDHGITDEQVDFLELYFAAGGFFNEAFNNDPRHECMRYFDNHYQPNAKTIREMLPSQPIPPPVGAIADVDYVVGGKITGSRGHYSMTVFLEDAKTRDPITSASVQFSNPGDAMAAGEQAERSMAPLFDKIRDYQKRLRDGSNDMAIRAKLKVTPSRDKMNVGEQQSVEVFVYDCDGEDHPLKNRKIKLSSGNGTFSPAEVTTGSDGKVKATFTAQKKGLAGLDATYYPYTTVTHHESGSHQNAT
ncbi:MAG: Ig-like domain-containing protein, partial [Pyrinomonadaceae bacterium]